MLFASTVENTVDFPLSLDFFDSGLYKRTAVARLTLALAKLSCRNRQQRGIKPRFRFGSVLPKNRGFGTDFDNRNNTNHYAVISR